MEKKYSYEELVSIISKLRSEEGCPWDREQTHTTLIPCLLEESYELMEALQNNDMKLMKEELGDVLLQIIMHSQIAKEENEFSIDDVINDLATKLVYRHPHVFKDTKVKDVEEVLKNWEELKKDEKNEKTLVESMDRVAKTLPSLIRSQKVQKKAIKSGDLNNDTVSTIEQIKSLLENFENKDKTLEKQEKSELMGELLFNIVKISTFFDINPEIALTKSVEKFINRFRYIENSRVNKD